MLGTGLVPQHCRIADSIPEIMLRNVLHTVVKFTNILTQFYNLPGRQYRHISVDALQGRGEKLLRQQAAR